MPQCQKQILDFFKIVPRASECAFYGLTADGTWQLTWVLWNRLHATYSTLTILAILVADTLNFVQGVALVIKDSSKCKRLFDSLFGVDEVVTNSLGLCPTRWCLCTIAISCICAPLVATLDRLKDDNSVNRETRAKIRGLHKQALKGITFFSLLCCEALFSPCEAEARHLQSTKANVLG